MLPSDLTAIIEARRGDGRGKARLEVARTFLSVQTQDKGAQTRMSVPLSKRTGFRHKAGMTGTGEASLAPTALPVLPVALFFVVKNALCVPPW